MASSEQEMLTAMGHLRPGQIVSHFELEKMLGAGAMGVVFRARDVVLDRLVAIKFIYLSTPQMRTKSVRQALMARFKREARMMARVSHNALVSVHEASFEGEEPYIVMEYVDGHTLHDHMLDDAITPAQAVEIAWQAASALAKAWEDQQLIHRDLKPGNMMLTREGELKILDLGLAKALSDESSQANLTVTGMVMGTPYYMSPEQHMGSKGVDHRTDIFALGTILYQMLSGGLPWSGSNDFVLYQSKQEGANKALMAMTQYPKALVDLVYAMLTADRLQRLGDYRQIMETLERSLYKMRGETGKPLIGATSAPLPPSAIDGPTRVVDGLAAEQAETPNALGAVAPLGSGKTPKLPSSPPPGGPTMVVADLAQEQDAVHPRQAVSPAMSLLPGSLRMQAGELKNVAPDDPSELDPGDESPSDLEQAGRSKPRLMLNAGSNASGGYTEPAALVAAFPPGSQVGDYEIESLIGVGSVGAVFRAKGAAGQPLALKLFVNVNERGEPITLSAVEGVTRLIGGMEHDAVVPVLAMAQARGVVYQAMELFLGPEAKPVDLLGYCRDYGNDGLAEPEEFGPILRHLLGALDYAHQKGLPHGNLKPQNILLSLVEAAEEGYWQAELKITDFGANRLVGDSYILTSATRSLAAVQRGAEQTDGMQALLSTYDYMSPEQRRGEPATELSDIYTVGLLMLRLLTGRRQLERRTQPSAMRKGLGPEWDEAILRSLRERPSDRFQSAAELLQVLPGE